MGEVNGFNAASVSSVHRRQRVSIALDKSQHVRIRDMFSPLPGSELVELGLRDLREGRESLESLLVSVGSTRLRRIGLDIPEETFPNPEHRLYDLLEQVDSDSAHSRYNALIRKLVSFERAAECVKE